MNFKNVNKEENNIKREDEEEKENKSSQFARVRAATVAAGWDNHS